MRFSLDFSFFLRILSFLHITSPLFFVRGVDTRKASIYIVSNRSSKIVVSDTKVAAFVQHAVAPHVQGNADDESHRNTDEEHGHQSRHERPAALFSNDVDQLGERTYFAARGF